MECLDGMEKGVYIGETSRNLSERCIEHAVLSKHLDEKSFRVKHWADKHAEMVHAPKFKFEVVKHHKDSLSRMLRLNQRLEIFLSQALNFVHFY